MSARKRKQSAKAGKPRIVVTRSVKVFGTSSETTRRVSAKPKAASLKDSKRVTSRPRKRNPTRSGDQSSADDASLRLTIRRGAERQGTSGCYLFSQSLNSQPSALNFLDDRHPRQSEIYPDESRMKIFKSFLPTLELEMGRNGKQFSSISS